MVDAIGAQRFQESPVAIRQPQGKERAKERWRCTRSLQNKAPKVFDFSEIAVV